jgi:hypothetical protein
VTVMAGVTDTVITAMTAAVERAEKEPSEPPGKNE